MHRDAWQPAILLSVFLFVLTGPGNAAEKTTEAPQTPTPAIPTGSPAPPALTAIPIEEIATRATEVSNLVSTFRAKILPAPEVETIRKLVSQLSGNIDLELAETLNILREQPTLELLQTQEELWQRRQLQLNGWLAVLTGRASQLQDMLKRLADLETIWTATRAAAEAANAPGSMLEQIDATLAVIGTAPAPLREQRAIVLDVQSRVAQQAERCANILAQINQFQEQAVAGIMVRDSPPIWSLELWANRRTLLPQRIHRVALAYRAGILEYVHDPAAHMQRHLALFLVLALVFCLTRRQIHRWAAAGETELSDIMVFDRPFAAAVVITTFFATSPFSQVPITVRDVFQIVALVPIILLTQSTVEAPLVPGLYALGMLFTVDTVRQAFSGAPLIDQTILVFETLAGVMVTARLRHKMPNNPAQAEAFSPLLRVTIHVLLFSFAICLVAGSIGYLRLARLVTSGILAAGTAALGLYALVRVVSGLVAFALRVWPLCTLQMVLHHRILLERRVYGLLIVLAIIGWVRRYLDYVGLLEPTISFGRAILAAQLQRGSINLSVGDILAFLLTLLVAYLFSSFIRFVLEEDVYPRTRLSAGVSYAASSVLNYAILAIGFAVALGVLGMDLTKMTVLAGAFGVGIGFGLQSVVNNFVSGLILLFERPIHVGDIVQVGSLQGRVRRIGIRASIVRTNQGAEIIVPNATLITQEVTNWTLSDQLRRVDLPVGVSYGTAPRKVIELLEVVARAHGDVLQNPAPRALFMGYGDSSINFELRVWAEFAKWQQVHSDLTTAVYDAVYAAGMTFPFPQRDVHLLTDNDSKSVNVPVSDGNKATGEAVLSTQREPNQRKTEGG